MKFRGKRLHILQMYLYRYVALEIHPGNPKIPFTRKRMNWYSWEAPVLLFTASVHPGRELRTAARRSSAQRSAALTAVDAAMRRTGGSSRVSSRTSMFEDTTRTCSQIPRPQPMVYQRDLSNLSSGTLLSKEIITSRGEG